MFKTINHWRQSTPAEIENGALEMILVSSEEINISTPNREVPLWKLKAILKIMNLELPVNSAINSLQEPVKTMAQMSWEYGSFIRQDSPTVNLIKTVVNLTDEQVNDIFNQAELINL